MNSLVKITNAIAKLQLLTKKSHPHKMVKHTQTIRRQQRVSAFEHFVRLALKWLMHN